MEKIKTPSPDLVIRDMVISGLAEAVPEFMSRGEATERIREWYPEDQLAVVALQRRISQTAPLLAA